MREERCECSGAGCLVHLEAGGEAGGSRGEQVRVSRGMWEVSSADDLLRLLGRGCLTAVQGSVFVGL